MHIGKLENSEKIYNNQSSDSGQVSSFSSSSIFTSQNASLTNKDSCTCLPEESFEKLEMFRKNTLFSKMSDDEIKKIVLCFKNCDIKNVSFEELTDLIKQLIPTIKSLLADGIELTVENIQYRNQQQSILLKCGWDSIESFNKANSKNSESLVERLERMYGKKVANMSAEEKAKYLKSYFDTYFSELQLKRLKNASPEEAEKIKANIRKTQLTDFAKLLYNSSKEEYALFRDAIVYLAADNRDDGYIAILNSFDNPEERIEFNCQMSLEQLEILCTGRDQANDLPCEETVCNLTQVYNENLTTEKLEENIESFSEKDFFNIKNEYDELVAKIERGEQLTPAENDRFDELENNLRFYVNNASMQVIVAVEKGEIELANTSLETAKSLGYIEDICKCVAKRFSNLSQEAQKVFAKFMDEATNGEFSKVLDEVYNNANNSLNSTELRDSKESSSNLGSNNTSSSASSQYATVEQTTTGALGFNQATTAPPEIQAKTITNEKESNTKTIQPAIRFAETKTIAEVLSRGATSKVLNEYVKNGGGSVDVAKELLDSGNDNCVKRANKMLESLGDGIIKVIFSCLNTCSGRKNLIEHASYSVLKDTVAPDSYSRDFIEERMLNLAERNPSIQNSKSSIFSC